MINKTVKQIIEENPDKQVHLYDILGIWGELPLTELNLSCKPDAIEANGSVIKLYVG